jgi:hypothetical protein
MCNERPPRVGSSRSTKPEKQARTDSVAVHRRRRLLLSLVRFLAWVLVASCVPDVTVRPDEPVCGLPPPDKADCRECTTRACCDQQLACSDDEQCADASQSCLARCTNFNCSQDCLARYQNPRLQDLFICVSTSCIVDCLPPKACMDLEPCCAGLPDDDSAAACYKVLRSMDQTKCEDAIGASSCER